MTRHLTNLGCGVHRYLGNQRNMLLQNTLFRCGGAAIVLSNRPRDAFRAKYKLLHTVRTHRSDRDGYECVYECEDDTGLRGIRLSREITTIAGRALKDNLTLLGYVSRASRTAIGGGWSAIGTITRGRGQGTGHKEFSGRTVAGWIVESN